MRFFLALVSSPVVLFLAACTSSEFPKTKTLYVGLGAPPSNLDPRFATDAASQRINDLTYSALVRIGDDMQPAPELAESWTLSDKKIVFKIKKGFAFHSGRPLTTEDIVYSLSEYRRSSAITSALSSIDTIQVTGPEEITLTLRQNDAPLLSNLCLVKIIPCCDDKKIDGSGPLELVRSNDSEVVLKKALQSLNLGLQYDHLIFKVVRDDNTRFLKILKGELDLLINELPEEKVTELKNRPGIKVLITPGLNFNFVLLNLKNKKLASVDVRRALFSALQREDIVTHKLDGMAQLATTILSPHNRYALKDAQIKTMSIDQARAAIKHAGLEGQTIGLKTSSQASENGKIIARQLESLGLKIRLESFEWGTFYTDVKGGSFEMATMRWVGLVDPDLYRDTLASREVPPGRNRGYYSNPQFDKLVDQGRAEMDTEKRRLLYAKAQQIVLDELPILPLWYNSHITVMSSRVQGFVPMITGSYYPLLSVKLEK